MAKKKILIVDDSVDTRRMVSAWLKKHGYDTVFAADALQAMSVAKERPDVILLDFAKVQEAQSLSDALV